MVVYLINIALIFFWAFMLLLIKPNSNKKIAYCTIVCLQWVLISGLRNLSVGSDTHAYYNLFESAKRLTWEAVFSNLWEYVGNLGNSKISDPGYPILEKTFQIFFDDYRAFLIFIALLFTISLAVWIYKNSSMPCLSFIIYSCLFYSFYSITGHRQTIATALVVFIGYHFIKKKKLIPFLILIFFAFFIHKSSILFLPYYFLAHKKITWKYLAVFGAIFSAIMVLGSRFYAPIVKIIGYDYYNLNDTSVPIPVTYTAIVCLITVASLVFFKQIKNNNPNTYMFLYNAILIGTLTTSLTLKDQAFMRIQQYYTLFLMLMIPEIVKSIEKEYRLMPYIAGSGFLIFKMLQSCGGYSFFWQ